MGWKPGKNIKKAAKKLGGIGGGIAKGLGLKSGDSGAVRKSDLTGAQDMLNETFGTGARSQLRQDLYGARAEDARQFAAEGRGQVGAGQRDLGAASSAYRKVLSGESPSLAEGQVKQAADRAAKTGMAIASSGRGNTAAAQRAAIGAAADTQQDAAAQAGQIALQEQADARRGLTAAGQTRGSLGMQQYNQGTQGELAFEDRADQAYETNVNRALGLATGNRQQDAAADRAQVGALGNTISSGAGLAGALISDRDAKEGAQPGDDKAEEFLSALDPYEYEYKDEHKAEQGLGEHLGVMAQDLEKSDVGERFVDEDEDGTKRVNYAKMGPAVLASLAHLADEIKGMKEMRDG